jgi:AraC-like DNA-binding protein
MGKNLSFMVKIDISNIIALESEKHRRFFNNISAAPISCNVIAVTSLRKSAENHSLPYFTFTCVLQGTGKIVLNQNISELRPGSTFLRFPDETFSIYRSKNYVEFSIALPAEFGILFEKYYTKPVSIFELEITKQLLTSFEYFFNLARSTSSNKLLNSATEMFLFITEICCGEKHAKHLRENSFAERICDLMRKALNSNSPGPEVAKKIGMGYELFRKKFKQAMDISPKQYIMQLKFEKAAEMILNNYSIKEIAFELGYSEIPAFSRQFKKHYGISPAKYRQKNRHLYES